MKIQGSIACLTMILCAAPALAETGSTTHSPMTADQIVRKNVEARGGLAAWQKVSTMTMTGQMDLGKGVQAPYTIELKRGRKVRVELVFEGKTAVQVYDGTNGWKVRPFLGHADAEPFTAEEASKAAGDADIDGLLIGYAERGTKIKLEGVEPVEGHDAYKVQVTLKNGQQRDVWVDKATFLELKIDGTRTVNGKQRNLSTYFRDYRTVDGVKIPFKYETAVDGVKTTDSIVVEKVTVNDKLDDSMFAKLR